MQGQEVRVEKLIVDSMMKVINKLHFPNTPLALPNIIACLCDEMEVPYVASSPIEVVPKAKVITTTVPQPQIHMEHPAGNMPQVYGWGQLQEDMANLLAQQTAHADIYTNWALQQMNQNLVPIPPARIPRMIRENFQASRPLVHGMLRTRRSEGSLSGLDQQTLPAGNTPREPSADNN
ncbi:hypothetical protein PIB30_108850 [Stylosanthes scabra]|uniref:Uncharacterized protein n=1 Tax=Stylosanthes scabra TaxID=79078 RepID=A0ABU6S154_9FABA|nr:hypothetical protein [Stylosanthes scabra]